MTRFPSRPLTISSITREKMHAILAKLREGYTNNEICEEFGVHVPNATVIRHTLRMMFDGVPTISEAHFTRASRMDDVCPTMPDQVRKCLFRDPDAPVEDIVREVAALFPNRKHDAICRAVYSNRARMVRNSEEGGE